MDYCEKSTSGYSAFGEEREVEPKLGRCRLSASYPSRRRSVPSLFTLADFATRVALLVQQQEATCQTSVDGVPGPYDRSCGKGYADGIWNM